MPLIDLLLDRAISFVPLLLCLTIHEWAHAWTAWRLGDDTAKLLGRVSLNPFDHIDPVGTLLLPLMGIPFGWAKPVPINPLRFRSNISGSLGLLLTAAAGPASNLILALIASAALFTLKSFSDSNAVSSTEFWEEIAFRSSYSKSSIEAAFHFLVHFIQLNVVLACFNLLPIPPLDGSRIADALIPSSLRPLWNQFSQFGPILLIVVVFTPSVLGFDLLSWPIHWTNEWIHFLATSSTIQH